MLAAVLSLACLAQLATAVTVKSKAAPGLEQVDHVILYMQENRAFDHYFGTLAGVRGFHDPNVQINANGRSAFYQQVNATFSNATDYLLPFYINYQGEPGRANATQCGYAGSNSWANNQAALAAGANDQWVLANTPYSEGYYKRADIPVHYAIADAWSVADMYQEGVISCTDPNRVMWQTGSINIPGGNVESTRGPVLDNNDVPGCSALTFDDFASSSANYSCYPYDWPTVPEYLQELGVSWQFFQAEDNFGDNPLLFFENYQNALTAGNFSDPLVVKGLEYQPGNASSIIDNNYPTGSEELGGLHAFQKAAAAGTLPMVSYIVGPAALSEHPPYLPRDGAWYTRQIVEAVQNSPKYDRTVLLISYDETGGLADHVVPFHSPEGTPGEWIINPFTGNMTFAGPGFRLPFLAISPWTRGSNVFTEPADHTSQIMFLEKWLGAKGFKLQVKAINDWRRSHMSDLVSMFNFEKPDYSKVDLPSVSYPHSTDGHFDGVRECEETYGDLVTPTPPYGNQTEQSALFQESGFKTVRGAVTEGRYLVWESGSHALTYSSTYSRNKKLSYSGTAEKLSARHNNPKQLTVLEASDPSIATGNSFKIRFSSAAGSEPAYLDAAMELVPKEEAETFTIINQGASAGYTLQTSNGKFVSLANGKVSLQPRKSLFQLFSVTM